MIEQDLRKLSRADLLELLLQQSRELDKVRAELEIANRRLADRQIALERAGTIAEASFLLNGVFEAAEKACAQYMENIRDLSGRQEALCEKMERDTKAKCDQMIAEAQYQSELYWEIVNKKVDQLLDSQKGLRELLRTNFK